jgi:hypothetical protein
MLKELNNKQKLIIAIITLAILILIVAIIKNWPVDNGTKKIDYKNVNSESLINESTVNSDGGIYWSLDEIVKKYIASSIGKDTAGNKTDFISLDKYYDILVYNYQKYLSKAQYTQLSNDFCSKFIVEEERIAGDASPTDAKAQQKIKTFDSTTTLQNVYEFETNRYICKVYSGKNNKTGYIGIELDSNTSTWNIFYIE